LLENAQLIRLDERSFDISDQPTISLSERQRAILTYQIDPQLV